MKTSVCVFKPKGRPCYQAQWTDPESGRKKTRSTGERTKRAALKFAAKLEADIREGRFRERRRVKWADFRDRYEIEAVSSKREKTQLKIAGTLNLLEQWERPGFLQSIDAATISGFATKRGKPGGRNQPLRRTCAISRGCSAGRIAKNSSTRFPA